MWHRLFDTYWKLSDSIDKLREEVWDADDGFHRDVNRIANELEIIRLEEIRVPDTIHPEEKRNNWGSRISSLIEKLEPYIKPYITKIDDAVGQLQRQISQVVQKAGGVVDDTFRLEPIAGETIETLGKEVVQESGEAAGREILQEGSGTVETIQSSLDVKEEVQTVVADEVKTGIESGSKTIITPEIEEKILLGQRKNSAKNELRGGHSPIINNANPNYAVEVLQTNTDETQKIKFVIQYDDGNLSNIKTSTIFPDSWSDDRIIESIKAVGDSSPIGIRTSDGAMLYRKTIDGVQIEVIKIGDTVISGYPTGGEKTGLLPGFNSIEYERR